MGSVSIVMVMTSCQKDGEFHSSYSFGVPTINIVTSLADGTSEASQGGYNFDMVNANGEISGAINTSKLIINGKNVDLRTTEIPVKADYYNYWFENLTGTVTGYQNLTNGNFHVTVQYNTPSSLKIEPSEGLQQLPQTIIVGQYLIGDQYKVATFQQNTFFSGVTVTQYPNGSGGMDTFTPSQGENDKPMVYQLSLDLEKNQADVIIYNAKFAPPSPSLTEVHIKGLNLDFTGGVVKVSGENIIPLVPEGEGEERELQEYDKFPFNNFELITTNDNLTNCAISYTVASVFKGQFNGSYLQVKPHP